MNWILKLLGKTSRSQEPSVSVTEGWTDDMNIQIAADRTLDELVDFVLQAAMRRDDDAKTIAALVEHFKASEEDAALALDRACGGVVRAATRNPHNCPDQKKDPIAWLSYQRCLREPSIIGAIYPQFASPSQTND